MNCRQVVQPISNSVWYQWPEKSTFWRKMLFCTLIDSSNDDGCFYSYFWRIAILKCKNLPQNVLIYFVKINSSHSGVWLVSAWCIEWFERVDRFLDRLFSCFGKAINSNQLHLPWNYEIFKSILFDWLNWYSVGINFSKNEKI